MFYNDFAIKRTDKVDFSIKRYFCCTYKKYKHANFLTCEDFVWTNIQQCSTTTNIPKKNFNFDWIVTEL